MAARRAVAAGSACPAKSCFRFFLGPGRPHDQAATVEMGTVRRQLSRRQGAPHQTICRPRCCCRWAAPVRRFLAYADFAAYTEWNNSLIYSTTAAYLATRIAGASPECSVPRRGWRELPCDEVPRVAAAVGARGFRCRQGRWRHGPAEPHRRQDDADQIRPAGGFLGRQPNCWRGCADGASSRRDGVAGPAQ